MSSNHTQNFSLSQWLPEDSFKREDFNADNAAIDAALGSCLRAMTGSYVGTGTYGSTNQNTLTFDHTPKLVIINSMGKTGTGSCVFIWGTAGAIMTTTSSSSKEAYLLVTTYSGNTVSWYSTEGAYLQLNYNSNPYNYIALY